MPDPKHPNPEVGLGDLFKLAQMIEEAIVSGQGEIPAVKLKVAGRRITLGPCPVKVG